MGCPLLCDKWQLKGTNVCHLSQPPGVRNVGTSQPGCRLGASCWWHRRSAGLPSRLEARPPGWRLPWPEAGSLGASHVGLPTGLLSVLQRGGQWPLRG